jgi:outer membrane translocation and assembly module TamA
LGGVGFVDAADVTETAEDLRPQKLHLAVGGGLRVLSPIGAVRFDLAFRANRYRGLEPDTGSRFTYHLSIGESF